MQNGGFGKTPMCTSHDTVTTELYINMCRSVPNNDTFFELLSFWTNDTSEQRSIFRTIGLSDKIIDFRTISD